LGGFAVVRSWGFIFAYRVRASVSEDFVFVFREDRGMLLAMSESLESQLAEVFRAVLSLESDFDPTPLVREESPAWDSMAGVTLFSAIESEFELQLEYSDAARMVSFAETLKLVQEKKA
jgi:acyl carrier protein